MARPDHPINTSEQFGDELTSWEERLTQLQNAYEKYFVGIDRRPPDKERKLVSEGLRRLRTTIVKNTALRFRKETMFARLLSFERMWDRTLREMEEGTYRRDLFKARLRQGARHGRPEQPGEGALAQNEQPPAALPEIAQPSMPPPPARMSQPPPASISDSSMKRLYATYLKAREQCGESNAGLSFDAVASKIKAQIPQLLSKHNARAVDFKVVIKGGRAVLKAVPKT